MSTRPVSENGIMPLEPDASVLVPARIREGVPEAQANVAGVDQKLHPKTRRRRKHHWKPKSKVKDTEQSSKESGKPCIAKDSSNSDTVSSYRDSSASNEVQTAETTSSGSASRDNAGSPDQLSLKFRRHMRLDGPEEPGLSPKATTFIPSSLPPRSSGKQQPSPPRSYTDRLLASTLEPQTSQPQHGLPQRSAITTTTSPSPHLRPRNLQPLLPHQIPAPTRVLRSEARSFTTSAPSKLHQSSPLLRHKMKRPSTDPPVPTAAYLSQSLGRPLRLSTPQPLLLVLDLNGTLVHRHKGSKSVIPRPGLPAFLNWLASPASPHRAMMWSSARPYNVASAVSAIFTPQQRGRLLAVWGRNTLGLSAAEYAAEVQVYKRLETVWADRGVQAGYPGAQGGDPKAQGGHTASQAGHPGSQAAGLHGVGPHWGQHNTLLVDDSEAKAVGQPFNHVRVPEFRVGRDAQFDEAGAGVLQAVRAFLEEAATWSDVSQFVRGMAREGGGEGGVEDGGEGGVELEVDGAQAGRGRAGAG